MINLNDALRWKTATPEEAAVLDALQGNILKGHGRRCTRHLFLKFSADQAKARKFLRDIEPFVVSAGDQLRQAETFKATGQSGGPFVAVLLSAEGYTALGFDAGAPTAGAAGEAFAQGMRARRDLLADPAQAALDPGYQGAIHAMILLAGDPDGPDAWESTATDNLETKILNIKDDAAEVVASERGRAIFNAAGNGLEHFGYVDGRSQPLLLVEDVEHEISPAGGGAGTGPDDWNPRFPLSQVLVKDPGSPGPEAFGSYFVFRKLEQNVKAFKAAEDALGDKLGNGELAGSMIVGRWEDGSAVELTGVGGLPPPITNNFNYDKDPDGVRCPLHGHIRKTNPRGQTVELGGTVEFERSHLMARRGITYGKRSSVVDPADEPQAGVGLLFMAYQADLSNQFEFTQASWANNPDFIRGGVGRDPIIGQGGVSVLHNPNKWDDAAAGTQDAEFGGFVTLKGGEYFFAPSKPTLASL